MSILIFFLVLFVLVLVHEWGHFIVAKKTGMRVDEFGIGFPPKLFGIKKGETEYTFNALPIGGFVKIWGENYDDTLEEGGDPRGFSSRPKWAQALVLIAGVTMNILFAWLLFSITYMIGVPTQVDEATASSEAQLYIAGTLEDGPANALPVGSVITSVGNQSTTISYPSQSEFSDFIANSNSEKVYISYKYRDEISTVDVLPVKGLMQDDPEKLLVGVSLVTVDLVSKPFFTAIVDGFSSTIHGLVAITTGLYSLISQAFVGEADLSQVAGPVGIVGLVGEAAAIGVASLMTFTAVISLNLAVINLLPFPALDGGRLVFVAIEAVSKKQIPPEWAGRVNLVGFAILMLLMIAVTYNDIIRLL